MFSSGIKLCTSADFVNAMFFGVTVTVWQNGQIIDCGGKITKHSDESVYINDGYYLKVNCEFKVRYWPSLFLVTVHKKNNIPNERTNAPKSPAFIN